MESAPLSTPRRRVFRDPWLWLGVIIIAGVLVVAVVSVRHSNTLAAARDRFETHLQAENYIAAAQDLLVADPDGSAAWGHEARSRLSAVQGQVANYQKAKDKSTQRFAKQGPDFRY